MHIIQTNSKYAEVKALLYRARSVNESLLITRRYLSTIIVAMFPVSVFSLYTNKIKSITAYSSLLSATMPRCYMFYSILVQIRIPSIQNKTSNLKAQGYIHCSCQDDSISKSKNRHSDPPFLQKILCINYPFNRKHQ